MVIIIVLVVQSWIQFDKCWCTANSFISKTIHTMALENNWILTILPRVNLVPYVIHNSPKYLVLLPVLWCFPPKFELYDLSTKSLHVGGAMTLIQGYYNMTCSRFLVAGKAMQWWTISIKPLYMFSFNRQLPFSTMAAKPPSHWVRSYHNIKSHPPSFNFLSYSLTYGVGVGADYQILMGQRYIKCWESWKI